MMQIGGLNADQYLVLATLLAEAALRQEGLGSAEYLRVLDNYHMAVNNYVILRALDKL